MFITDPTNYGPKVEAKRNPLALTKFDREIGRLHVAR